MKEQIFSLAVEEWRQMHACGCTIVQWDGQNQLVPSCFLYIALHLLHFLCASRTVPGPLVIGIRIKTETTVVKPFVRAILIITTNHISRSTLLANAVECFFPMHRNDRRDKNGLYLLHRLDFSCFVQVVVGILVILTILDIRLSNATRSILSWVCEFSFDRCLVPHLHFSVEFGSTA